MLTFHLDKSNKFCEVSQNGECIGTLNFETQRLHLAAVTTLSLSEMQQCIDRFNQRYIDLAKSEG